MLQRAVLAWVPLGCSAADAVYGQNQGLADWLYDQQSGYVLAVPCSELVTVAAGRGARTRWPPGARRSVASPVLRCRFVGAAAVSLGAGRCSQRCSPVPVPQVAAPELDGRSGAALLLVLLAALRGAVRARLHGRRPLDSAGQFRRGLERDRPVALPGQSLSGLLPAHHPDAITALSCRTAH